MSEVESAPAAASVPQQRQESASGPAARTGVVREFQMVHDAMRHAVAVLADAGAGLTPGPSTKARQLGAFADFLLVFVHHHHSGEDEHWWPSLRERSAAAGTVLAPLTDDHHDLDPLLDALRGHAAQLKAGAHDPGAVARDTAALRDHLLEHLAAEEPVLFPLLTEHMDKDEAERLGRLMAKSAPKSGLSYLLGLLDDTASPQEQQLILGKMPPPIRWLRPLMLRSYRKAMAPLTTG